MRFNKFILVVTELAISTFLSSQSVHPVKSCSIDSATSIEIRNELDLFAAELESHGICLYNNQSKSFDWLKILEENGELPYVRKLRSNLLDSLGNQVMFSCDDLFITEDTEAYIANRRFIFELKLQESLTPSIKSVAKDMLRVISVKDMETDYFRYRILMFLYINSYESVEQWSALTNFFSDFEYQDSILIHSDEIGEIYYRNQVLNNEAYESLVDSISRLTKIILIFDKEMAYSQYLKLDLTKFYRPLTKKRDSVANVHFARPFIELEKIEDIKFVYNQINFRIKKGD